MTFTRNRISDVFFNFVLILVTLKSGPPANSVGVSVIVGIAVAVVVIT